MEPDPDLPDGLYLAHVELSILQSRYEQDISNLLKLFSAPEISRVEISRQQ